MLYKTKGIVLNYIPYKETSIIVKIYTELFGLQTYIENGVRTSKGKNKIALFQPLSILDLVVYANPKREIQRISEIKIEFPFHEIPYKIKKTSISIFLSEVLSKCLKEEESNSDLFNFLENSIKNLDLIQNQSENFHLYFLFRLTAFLGFMPKTVDDFKMQIKVNLNDEEIRAISHLFESTFMQELYISNETRTSVLAYFLDFFKLHIEGFGDLKSLAILKEVLS